MQIGTDDPHRADVLALLEEHLEDMYATSPPESVHALEPGELAGPGMRFWTARRDGVLLGCVALKSHDADHVELKSMRTASVARRQGVAAALLEHVLAEARALGASRISLETGVEDYFSPARALYGAHGFVPCAPFADYVSDPNSVFLTRPLP
ncbi:MAG TPA: GNAT family N-acetyltransferase [Nocardioides sp.]|nr:GNAT family N-acetyltransferase [Nocardioides sp.]